MFVEVYIIGPAHALVCNTCMLCNVKSFKALISSVTLWACVHYILIRLAHLQCESLLFRSPRLSVCRLLSVCPASDLGNYASYVGNFAVLLGNLGPQARIWHQILRTLVAWFVADIFFTWGGFGQTRFRSLFSSLGYYPFVPVWFKHSEGNGDANSGRYTTQL